MTTPASTEGEISRLEQIQEYLDQDSWREAAALLRKLQPAEIAHVLEALPLNQRQILWDLLETDQDGETLMELTENVRNELLQNMHQDDIVAATEHMDVDDLADFIQELPSNVTEEVMRSLDEQDRRRLETVLSYPEDTAGGLMNTDTVTVRPEVTLDVVLRYLRQLGERVPRDTDQLFVTNRDDKYLGTLRLADLVTNDPNETVAEVMSLGVQPFNVFTPDSDVARRFEQYDLLSAPVVDEQGHLVGRITVDDVVDLIREEGEHQFMGSAGLSEDEDMFAPVLESSKRRAVWLGINLLTAFLASWVIGHFEDTLERIVALAVLMPIVASMGGVGGTQTLTLAIRGIALGQLSSKNAGYLLAKELAVALVNGLLWAVVVGIIAGIWFHSTDIALVIAAAMIINLIAAAIVGALLPLALDKLGIDPALAGGVLLTTVTDVVGFLSFLGLATLFLL
ncbi:magnesium transporter [Thiolapillus brandeum]|uniref:Magnesium transporter MgtE n=1 Tax=Thiolapillus brandeum TaxID=1076588 RepID=A0A7U6JGB4_9GAMM|nr:magnesium transporter [Thiolapillus brandeum]BAO43371.1 magnesium transporter [Thiolapillus brandeum]